MSGSIWQRNSGIYLGFEADRLEGARPALRNPLHYDDGRHIVTIGPSGSGKTKRLLVPALAETTGWSVVVNDIKGELCAITEEHRRRAGSHIIKLNPFDLLGLGSSGFNPIAAMDLTREFPDDALELAESVIKLEGKEPHWAQAAQELVAALIMYVRLLMPGGSFADVRALLGQTDDGIRTMVLSPSNFVYKGKAYPGMIEAGIQSGWEEIGIKAGRFGDITPENKEIHSVLSTALIQTRWLDSLPIKDDLARNPFDFGELKRRPTTVYLILPAHRLATHSSWMRLMVASAVQKLMRDTKRSRVPVLFALDEFAALAGGSGVGDQGDGFPAIAGPGRMAMFRGYGIKLWTVWQDLAQIQKIYGAGYETFFGNAGILQCFAPQDVVTAEYISKRTGQKTIVLPSHGESLSPNPMMPGGTQWSESNNLSYIPMPLMLPQEVRNMDDGFSLIFTHKAKGPVRSYAPYPTELPHLRDIMARDPAN
jgi:type IV secretion system protein VirD4